MDGRSREQEKGISLIELLVAGAIGAMLLTTLAVSTGFFLDNYAMTLDEQDLTLAHHIALERMLVSIAMASEAVVPSATALQNTFPDSRQELFSWSGTAGEPLVLVKDGGAGNPLADGVVDVAFSANTTNVIVESFEVLNEELFRFEGYSDYTYVWEDMVLSDTGIHGMTLTVLYVAEVEQMVLQTMELMLGRAAGQTAALKVSLYEGQSEERPRIWDDVIATHVVPNSDIPAAIDNGGSLEIPWMTISLPETFTIQPNRFYCFLFQAEGAPGEECGCLRVAAVTGGTGPINNMAYMGSTDGGQSWYPCLQTQEYRQKDVPVRLNGEITVKLRSFAPRTESIDVTLGMAIGGSSVTGKGRAYVRGGGDVRYN